MSHQHTPRFATSTVYRRAAHATALAAALAFAAWGLPAAGASNAPGAAPVPAADATASAAALMRAQIPLVRPADRIPAASAFRGPDTPTSPWPSAGTR